MIEVPTNVNMSALIAPLAVISPFTERLPLTVSLASGESVPIPTSPSCLIVKLEVPVLLAPLTILKSL